MVASNVPSPFGGAGGLFGERPPLGASDEEFDKYAEYCYNKKMAHFEALVAFARKPKRRRFHDYTRKNCEESRGNRHAG